MNNPQLENQIAQADILASLSHFQPVSINFAWVKNFKKYSQNGENEIANIPQIGVNDLETLVKQLELENQCLKLENAILNDFCKRNNLH